MTPSARYRAMRAYQRARISRSRLFRQGETWRGVRVLGYHRISTGSTSLAVPADAFRAQMEAVSASGAAVVRLTEALDLLASGPVEGRYIAVTFDDGYRDNVENAEPVLGDLGIPATIFLPTAVIDGTSSYRWFSEQPAALTWDEVAAADERGVFDFQSHTRTHPWLPDLDDRHARDEIAGSKEDLERRLGKPVSLLCYPGGLFGSRDEQLLAEAGYRAGVSTTPGTNTADTRCVRRTLIYREDGPDVFEAKLAGYLDRPGIGRRVGYRRLGGFSRA